MMHHIIVFLSPRPRASYENGCVASQLATASRCLPAAAPELATSPCSRLWPHPDNLKRARDLLATRWLRSCPSSNLASDQEEPSCVIMHGCLRPGMDQITTYELQAYNYSQIFMNYGKLRLVMLYE
jgi:hypothetical protein